MLSILKEAGQSKYTKSPWLESIIMATAIIASFLCLAFLSVLSDGHTQGEMSTSTITLIILAFFVLSTAIAMIAVIAGIGGGVIFTPIMLAFTDVNSLVVRGTGIIVAMFSGPVSIGIFTKKGLTNYRLSLVMTISQSIGALTGATLAIITAAGTGVTGEGFMRFGLGLILLALAVFFLSGGKKLEKPEIAHVDNFTKSLKLEASYHDESEGVVRSYKVKRAPLGIILLFVIGILGGFFGMGGGWAITPALNLGMGLPLRLAAANSNVILGIGGCVSVWPYIFAGSIIPMFVLPWMAGQVVGGFIGAHLLARIKIGIVRIVLIGIMIFTSFTLVTRGLEMLGVIGVIPAGVQVALFIAIMIGISAIFFLKDTKKSA
ncbi:MAG: sulfite exporter TauE/SafE family protein [Defluviitaleaceae bacterium]|nr:sulfite exporter TauE/SafE family protein [Defluviitaleaceae bacterium]